MLAWLLTPLFALPLVAIVLLFVRRRAMLATLDPDAGGGISSSMLESLGLDPTKPVQLEFTLAFPTRDAAVAAAADFPSPQWSTTVAAAAGDEGWPCTASTESVVNKAILDALITLCREVASGKGGSLQSWQVRMTR